VSTQPTIGRIVHYTSYGSADGRWKSKCRASIVTEVHPSATPPTIGLAAINPTGIFFDREVREDDDHTGGTWHWPCTTSNEQEEEA
jgi:hypothetical protein